TTSPIPQRPRSGRTGCCRACAAERLTAAGRRDMVESALPRHPADCPARRPRLRRDAEVSEGAAVTLLRRAITVPLVTVLMVGILVVWPLLLVIGGVAGLIGRSRLPLRALWQRLSGGQNCDQLMRDLLERGYTVGRRTLNIGVLLDGASPTPEQIPREEPMIVLSRHCGPGDTLLVAWLLGIHYRLQLRIVLKALLRCEPVLDLAGDLCCLCFLRHRHKHAGKQIHDLAASLGS